MAVTRQALVQRICDEQGYVKSTAGEIIDALFENMKKTLASGEEILITGFGKFCVKDKAKRRGRNPQTGESLVLDSRRVVTFKCSSKLKDSLNGSG